MINLEEVVGHCSGIWTEAGVSSWHSRTVLPWMQTTSNLILSSSILVLMTSVRIGDVLKTVGISRTLVNERFQKDPRD